MFSIFWDFLEDKNKRPTSIRERNSKVRAAPGNLHWAGSCTSPGVNEGHVPPQVWMRRVTYLPRCEHGSSSTTCRGKAGQTGKIGRWCWPRLTLCRRKVRVSSSVPFQTQAHRLPLTSFGWQQACSVCASFLCVLAESMCDRLVWLHGDGHQRAWAVLPSHKAPTFTNPN